jgi:cytochrome o ubiquinol oxidase operon protein cyoD
MSADTTHASNEAAHHSQAHGGHGHDEPHGSMREYMIGFGLSVILTAIPFWLIINHVIADKVTAGLVISAFAAVQVVVHMIFFLHMNGKVEGGWNLLALIFTAIVVLIVLSGSLWVMYHLQANMMPTMAQMQNLPG